MPSVIEMLKYKLQNNPKPPQTPEDCYKGPTNAQSMSVPITKHKRPAVKMERYESRESPPKRRRTKEDFIAFCTFVLRYTKYQGDSDRERQERHSDRHQERLQSRSDRQQSDRHLDRQQERHRERQDRLLDRQDRLQERHKNRTDYNLSPVGSGGESYSSSDSPPSTSPNVNPDARVSKFDDSLDVVTCHCMKPYGGRPMIECSSCLTWVHLSCAKIRKMNIPDVFICAQCRADPTHSRKSSRVRTENKRISV